MFTGNIFFLLNDYFFRSLEIEKGVSGRTGLYSNGSILKCGLFFKISVTQSFISNSTSSFCLKVCMSNTCLNVILTFYICDLISLFYHNIESYNDICTQSPIFKKYLY